MTSLQEQKPPRSFQDEVRQIKPRKPYSKPEIIVELEMEVRAGSPLGIPDPLDPLDLGLPPQ